MNGVPGLNFMRTMESKISPTDWKSYEQGWATSIRKHNFESEYALNLMDNSLNSIRMLPYSYTELLPILQKFTEIWSKLLKEVKQYEPNIMVT